MKAAPIALALGVLSLAPAPPASAGWFAGRDDCAPGIRHARCEYEAEHRVARGLQDLDCASLAAYAESARASINARTLAAYNRPRYAAPAAAAPASVPPPAAPGPPVFAPPRVR